MGCNDSDIETVGGKGEVFAVLAKLDEPLMCRSTGCCSEYVVSCADFVSRDDMMLLICKRDRKRVLNMRDESEA